MYNITFRLGDPSKDGHNIWEEFHIKCNYSAKEIDYAYKQATEILSVDFVKSICSDFECNVIGINDCKKLNTHYQIIPKEYINEGFVYDIDPNLYIELYFNIIKIILPDLKYEYRDLKEESLNTIDGGAYGLY